MVSSPLQDCVGYLEHSHLGVTIIGDLEINAGCIEEVGVQGIEGEVNYTIGMEVEGMLGAEDVDPTQVGIGLLQSHPTQSHEEGTAGSHGKLEDLPKVVALSGSAIAEK